MLRCCAADLPLWSSSRRSSCPTEGLHGQEWRWHGRLHGLAPNEAAAYEIEECCTVHLRHREVRHNISAHWQSVSSLSGPEPAIRLQEFSKKFFRVPLSDPLSISSLALTSATGREPQPWSLCSRKPQQMPTEPSGKRF